MKDVLRVFAAELPHYFKEVFVSLLPVIGSFIVFQLISRKYHKRKILRMSVGFI